MPPFYDLDEQKRIALTQQAIQERRTLLERWGSLMTPESEGWSERAALAADFLKNQSGVADMGCGTMTLEKYLTPGVGYYPVDVVRRDHRTLVCDFNAELPPPTDATAVACLGLLEYLFDPLAFLRETAARYQVGVVSYCPVDAEEPLEPRRSHAWVNDYTIADLEELFEKANWKITRRERIQKSQMIWRLQQRSEQSI